MPKSKRVWLLIADGEKAKILSPQAEPRPGWIEVRSIESIDQHHMNRDLRTDRPGREQMHATGVHHAFDPRSDAKRQSKQAFGQMVIDELSKSLDHFDEWILAAPPQSLGDLRTMLPPALQEKLRLAINKDLTKTPLSAIPDHLPWPYGNQR